jgi:hypothetical protein
VVTFGLEPGDESDLPHPAFYASVDPEPARLTDRLLRPVPARWRGTGSRHRAVLAYEVVRATPDPRRTLLDFYESAYMAVTSS